MSITLGVNIDHIATLRNARGIGQPDILIAAHTCLGAGADLIVCHLRGDRRHINESDLLRLREGLNGYLHVEMAATAEMEKIMLKIKPDSVCIVPEKPDELTTQGGLKFTSQRISEIEKTIVRLKKSGIDVSLFLDANPDDIRTAKKIGADIVELCTAAYSDKKNFRMRQTELEKLQIASVLIRELKMELHSGHGLDYTNASPIADIEGMQCLNIGFSIIARAMFTGLGPAVSEMKRLIS